MLRGVQPEQVGASPFFAVVYLVDGVSGPGNDVARGYRVLDVHVIRGIFSRHAGCFPRVRFLTRERAQELPVLECLL